MTEYNYARKQAETILKKLTIDERGFLRQASFEGVEKRAFRDVYHEWLGQDWETPAETIFILTEEDAQIMAKDTIGRELTEAELYAVSKGVQAGLEDWSLIMAIAIRGVTGEG